VVDTRRYRVGGPCEREEVESRDVATEARLEGRPTVPEQVVRRSQPRRYGLPVRHVLDGAKRPGWHELARRLILRRYCCVQVVITDAVIRGEATELPLVLGKQ